jgi:hypothetical protein
VTRSPPRRQRQPGNHDLRLVLVAGVIVPIYFYLGRAQGAGRSPAPGILFLCRFRRELRYGDGLHRIGRWFLFHDWPA